MTSETYLRILRDRLEEANVDPALAKKTLERETATIAGINDSAIAALLSEERLDFLVSAAAKRSRQTASINPIKSDIKCDLESTIVTQVSQTATSEATVVIPSHTEDSTKIESPDATVVAPFKTIPKQLLDSDTATVVISKESDTVSTLPPDEAATVPMTAVKEADLKKLLTEHETVHISEKATVEFFALVDEQPHLLDETSTATVDESLTRPLPTPTSLVADEEVNLLPFIDEAHHQKKQDAIISQVKTNDPIAQKSITEADLKNTHPILLSLAVLVILFPFLLVSALLFAAYFLPTSLILFLLVLLPIIFYTVTVSFSGGGTIYGAVFAIRALCLSQTSEALPFFVIFLGCSLILTLSVLFLHKPVVPTYRFFKSVFLAFLKKNSQFIKNLIRIFVRSMRHA